MRIEHVGIAVRSLDTALTLWQGVLHVRGSPPEEVEGQRVRVTFLDVGNSHIELLEPTASDSPIARFLAKRGEGIHHVAFGVPHLEETLAELKAAGYDLIDEKPRVGAGGHLVAFVRPASFRGVLTEYVQVDASGIEPETS